MSRASRHPGCPSRWWPALAVLCGLAVAHPARAQVAGCDLRAERWESEGGAVVLRGVAARCGGLELEGAEARVDGQTLIVTGASARARSDDLLLEGAEIRFTADPPSLEATTACLRRSAEPETVCCAQSLSRGDGGTWQLEDVTCELRDGAALKARGARWSADGIALLQARSGGPVALPYPTGHLDPRGRTAGLWAPSFGYHSERGLGVRANAYVPLGAAVDLGVGAFGETEGGAGADLELRWPGPGPAPRSLGGFVAWDGTTDRSVRAALRANAYVAGGSGLGVAAVGELWTDNAVGRDYGRASTERLRPDRHLAVAGWAGGSGDRLWLGTYYRQLGALPAAPSDTPIPDQLGLAPALGWLATLDVFGVGEVAAALRFDRSADSSAGSSANRLRLASGGELWALSWPALTVQPGLWLEAEADFSDPEEREGYRRFDTRVTGSLAVSSPWIGGSAAVHHLLEPRARLLWTPVEATDTEGTAPELAPVETAPPSLALEIGLDQTVVAGPWRFTAPLDWLGGLDDGLHDSRLVLRTSVERTGRVVWRLDQRVELDTEPGELAAFTAATSLEIGGDRGGWDGGRPLLGGAGVGVGASITLAEAERVPLSALFVPEAPLLARSPTTTPAETRRGARTWASADLGPAGLSISATWPFVLDERPDLLGALWVGRSAGLRLLATGGVLTDDTVLAQLSLVLGGQAPRGPWTP